MLTQEPMTAAVLQFKKIVAKMHLSGKSDPLQDSMDFAGSGGRFWWPCPKARIRHPCRNEGVQGKPEEAVDCDGIQPHGGLWCLLGASEQRSCGFEDGGAAARSRAIRGLLGLLGRLLLLAQEFSLEPSCPPSAFSQHVLPDANADALKRLEAFYGA